RSGRQADVPAAQVPAVPRARRGPQGSAGGESRARSAHVAGAAESGLDSRVAQEPADDPAGYADAGVLAGLPEVVLPAPERRTRGADPRDSRSYDDVPRRPEPENERREEREQQLGGKGIRPSCLSSPRSAESSLDACARPE